jgi:ATP-binding cassette subfamily F protein 3
VEDGRLVSYEGGWADYARARAEREAIPEPKPERPDRAPKASKTPKRKPPRELDELEGRIESQQQLVEALEAKLAADWTDVDTIAAHRRARDDLRDLFARWETLVDEVAT